jgi:predicted ATPase/DNA-binding winged helix-turn-helix (wHTH) protein
MKSEPDDIYLFGPFRLYVRARRFEKHGVQVSIGSRALDLLIALISDAGQVVEKRELMSRAWRNIIVDESNLRVTIASLRRALGEAKGGGQYVANVSGSGYSFVADVKRVACAEAGGSSAFAAPSPADIDMQPLDIVVGREDDLRRLSSLVSERRIVTIVGAPGIGKSTLARTFANTLTKAKSLSLLKFDLDAYESGAVLASEVITRLSIETAQFQIKAKTFEIGSVERLIVIFDNCELHVEEVAQLVSMVCSRCDRAQVICTSREALRINGEYIHFIEAFSAPPASVPTCIQSCMAFPAFDLFVQIARASGAYLDLDNHSAALIGDLCRRLDAHPLAIRLAAMRVPTFGLSGLHALLNGNYRLYWLGDRAGSARHRDLATMIDVSYYVLDEPSKDLLIGLSSSDQDIRVDELLNSLPASRHFTFLQSLESLVSKSLLSVRTQMDGVLSYGLTETMRLYCLEASKLRSDNAAFVDPSKLHAMPSL